MEREVAHPIQSHPISTEESQAEKLEARRRSYAEHITALAGLAQDSSMGSGANGQPASVTLTFGELRTNGERTW
jgi:hypothetical protein